MDSITREAFLRHLRVDLTHLYDAEHLRRSPLAVCFGVADRFDTAAALRRILFAAIEALKPKLGEPPQGHAWELYESLHCCYVQRLSQQVVADQLGMSSRQLRREQHVALELLADQVWEQYELGAVGQGLGVGGQESGSVSEPSPRSPVPNAEPPTPAVTDELFWLRDAPPAKPVDLGPELRAVLDLLRSLAEQHRVSVAIELADALPRLAVHPVALRQMLLSLLGVVIPQAMGHQVMVSAEPAGWELDIALGGAGEPPSAAPITDDDAAGLEMAGRLAELCGGRLVLSAEFRGSHSALGVFSRCELPGPGLDHAPASTENSALTTRNYAHLFLPAVERLPVLVVDDNADTLQLLQRYVVGTRYRLVGSRNPEEALVLAERLSPRIIVLDVMMPEMDGWNVLARLRQHPSLGRVPIIVCTVMAQEKLALSLGASGFVKKPVTPQAFLAALDRGLQQSS